MMTSSKWKPFPHYWPFVRGIHRSPVNSPHKGQWRGALMFSLICVWINGWVNNREAGDLRRYRAHYDVNVMFPRVWSLLFLITISVLYQRDNYKDYWDIYINNHSFWVADLGSLKLGNFGSTIAHLAGCSALGPSFRILDRKCYHRITLCLICILDEDIEEGSFSLCKWLSFGVVD